ncbi:uncharacterized protein LOC129923716 [Biomphalaria glabrata]|uniref:Uncharacterized protein LOC129923716 n=1 Tax=Biomphalaria glabrata TaxID=6526 RepID=A0A9W2ZB64_BIOGL|nr:uncharacterized protein LOC129923716 [Biomphalaria glabrata]
MTLLHVIGQEAVQVYNTFQWTDNECNECEISKSFHTLHCILNKFEKYCLPRKNVTIERHVFFQRSQHEGESFDNFVTDIKLKAKTCEFDLLKDSLIKDRIVGGIRNENTRARLLREPDLDLNKAENICRAAEETEWQLKLMNEESGVHVVNSATNRFKRTKGNVSCSYCGKEHRPRQCPAYGETCHKCHKKGHFSSVCRSKPVSIVKSEGRDDSIEETFFIGSIGSHSLSNEWNSLITVENKQVTFTLDTGAQVNILPYRIFKQLKRKKLLETTSKLTTYSGERLKVVGKAHIKCTVKSKTAIIEFQIVETYSKPIMGLPGCQQMNLIRRVDFIEDDTLSGYADVFTGLGCMEEEYNIL